ncbi:polysaccharide pyruvyl transferase CsaB [Synechococcus elongatus]|uniref:Polysaccharide pyruvyl transferase domain-containing protein n=2 Tax=Synechococcus elongatus TaxID=32046 RepID=Q31N10_SYNE7|nr:polysaccharide pyruvyl transferase CsaB [Synechococcus elongatus]ABB57559.1 conserved hypothetical protein [Synechococcus elongatus PCC 7942 = FACHB-805]AJD57907.1 polysaccharide pyruvyl transferase [Synechococcus elongatus UTEX 2973]MBD2588363.1 polysaccharide pyruvyl transferase CsaB [Synechococcus elongatus FACHB-242]MBD2689474.1 polysaccharide pyruvyl transferase CsaB [Synechococcus elongatus FACHB-1061]MBD2708107.1 polysaccharide pyruvyl transferase CsaB [Synechococcus elongatus PCC 79
MRALLCGYYGEGNGGDEALLAALLQLLPPTVEPLVLSGNPAATRTCYGVEACDRRSGAAVWQALRRSDLFIFGGGSLIQDVTSWTSPLYYCGLMGLAQQLGLKTIAWAQGIGPLQRKRTRWLARRTFQHCDRITVRDRGSAALLKEWGISVAIAPDPVWALEPLPLDQPLSNQEAIAVCLRPHPELTPERSDRLKAALTTLQSQTQAPILLIPFHHQQDRPLAAQWASEIPQAEVLDWQHPRQLLSYFQSVRLTIAMRFHGLVMAAAAGNRCFGLSYDPKVRRFLDALEQPGWDLPEIPDSAEAIAAAWLESWQAEPIHAAAIADLRQQVDVHRQALVF